MKRPVAKSLAAVDLSLPGEHESSLARIRRSVRRAPLPLQEEGHSRRVGTGTSGRQNTMLACECPNEPSTHSSQSKSFEATRTPSSLRRPTPCTHTTTWFSNASPSPFLKRRESTTMTASRWTWCSCGSTCTAMGLPRLCTSLRHVRRPFAVARLGCVTATQVAAANRAVVSAPVILGRGRRLIPGYRDSRLSTASSRGSAIGHGAYPRPAWRPTWAYLALDRPAPKVLTNGTTPR